MLKQNAGDSLRFDRRKEHLLDSDGGEELIEAVAQGNGQVEFSPLYNLHSADLNHGQNRELDEDQSAGFHRYGDVHQAGPDASQAVKGETDWVTQNLSHVGNEELSKVLEQVAANGAVDYVDDLLNLDMDDDGVHLLQQEDRQLDPRFESHAGLVNDEILNATQAAYPPFARERLRAASDEMLAALYANEELLGAGPILPQERSLEPTRRLSEGDALADRPLYVPSDSNRSLASVGRESLASQDGRKPRDERAQSNNSLYSPGLPGGEVYQRQNVKKEDHGDNDDAAVKVRFTTKFQPKYWRNDRKNLQCFPFCVEHDDYYTVRLYKLEHQRKGTCGTSVRANVTGLDGEIHGSKEFSSAHLAIGRISLLGPEGSAGFLKAGEQVSSEELAEMVNSSVKGSIKVMTGVHDEEESTLNTAVELEFVQALWKVNMVLSKKRRPVNIPSKIPRYAFEVILFRKSNTTDMYTVVAQQVSAPFQIASTRTLNRELKGLENLPASTQQRPMAAPKRKVSVDVYQDGLHQESVKRFKSPMLLAQQGNDKVKHIIKTQPRPEPQTTAQDVEQPKTVVKEQETPLEKRKEAEDDGAASAPNAGPGVERREGEGGQVVKPEGSDLPKEAPSAPPPTVQMHAGEGPSVRLESTQEEGVQVEGAAHGRGEALADWTGEYTELEFSLETMYIICLLGGIFGVHRFLMNDHFWGKFYAFTLGGLGIGYIIDLIRLPKLYEASNEKLRKLARDPYHREPELLSVTDAYIVLFSTGLFGGHHFLLGNKGTGYLYLFTLGMCGVGWLHDFFTISSMVLKYNAKQRDLFNLQYGARNDAGIELRNV